MHYTYKISYKIYWYLILIRYQKHGCTALSCSISFEYETKGKINQR